MLVRLDPITGLTAVFKTVPSIGLCEKPSGLFSVQRCFVIMVFYGEIFQNKSSNKTWIKDLTIDIINILDAPHSI